LVDVNVRSHRAGRKGFDSGFIDVPTSEGDLVVGDVYVSSIYIANTSASAVTVTLKVNTSPAPKTVYSKSLAAGGTDLLFFPEPVRFEGGIRGVASASGAVISIAGYQ
jgi:hypothetical protein